MRPVSVILPYTRPQGAGRCIEALQAMTGLDMEILAEHDVSRIGYPLLTKLLVELSKYDLILWLADDTIPQPGMIEAAQEAMGTLPDGWGLVGLNDGFHNGEELATHWLADKRLLPLLDGEYWHTGYHHCFADNELTLRCRELGRYVWAENARLVHDHPMVRGETVIGTDYAHAYKPTAYFRDQGLFMARLRNGWVTP
jgi:hypothetical protein